ncbi:hypothetical protein HWV62_30929 [Athelia sp. TMB]|nr:hypothetical protein HWV62_30929 [Athelia sp. TMB]
MITRSKRTQSQGSDRDGNVPPRKVARLEDGGASLADPSDIAQNTGMGQTLNAIDTSGTVTMIAGHYIEGDYNVVQGAGEIQDTLNLIHDEQKKRDINNWMAAPDTSPNYKAAREKHQQGTGSWFVGGSVFEEWKAHPDSVLWLHGRPGCGKTILCSSAIENVKLSCKNKGSVGYAYYFFDGTSAQSKLAAYESLIRSLIMQFSDRLDGIHPALAGLYDAEDKGRHQPLIGSLEGILPELIKSFPASYIIIDALDECAEQRRLLKWIQTIILQTSGVLHLLVTSRPEPDIQNSLRSLPKAQEIDVANWEVSDDIRDYINVRLAEVDGWSEPQKELVRAALSRGAGGVFRWVALLFDELLAERCLSTSELQQRLSTLPKDLNEAYMKIIKKSPRPADVIRFLQWIIFGQQEFTAKELAEVALINFGNGGEALPFCDSSRRYSSPDDVLRACSGLVVEVKEGIIKLAHLSVKEFLLSTEIPLGPKHSIRIDEYLSHCVIAEVCLAYLLQFNERESITEDNVDSFPLAAYASKQCVFHVQSTRDEDTNSTLERLIQHRVQLHGSYAIIHWIRLLRGHSETNRPFTFGSTENTASSLYYASIIGLKPLVDHLIICGADVNVIGGEYGTALQAASSEGHLEICQLLLEHGADLNASGGEYGTALQAASSEGHLEICQLLLEHGADLNASGGEYGTALQAASSKGHLEICQLLLEHGADLNASGGKYGAALLAALDRGHRETFQLLLAHGADVNVMGRRGSALHMASSYMRHRQICQLLLEHGADVNITGGQHGSALQGASYWGHRKICQLLLEHGADVNATGKYGNALQVASYWGRLEICQLLLAQGADLNVVGGQYGTALRTASMMGRLDICQLLLEHGADVNVMRGEYGTALQAASSEGHLRICQLLLDHGVDVNASGEYGTALQTASMIGRLDVCQLLLEHGADVNTMGGEYGTALQTASIMGYLDICQLLLEHGADVNASGGKHGTALRTASMMGRLDICQLLLEHGADVNASGEQYGTALQAALDHHGANVNVMGGEYGTALQAASSKGHLEICQLLLEHGADLNASGGEYGTALQSASSKGHLEICQLLLEHGADVNMTVGVYGPALQAASYRGRLDMCQLLLDHGADVNITGGQYGSALNAARAHSPYHWSRKSEAVVQAMVQLLKEHGAVETKTLIQSNES